MDTLLQDLRFAFRSLRRSPGFALTVILVMALGIGVNAMIFTIVRGILLQDLPFPNSDRIVLLTAVDAKYPDAVSSNSMSQDDANSVRERIQSFSSTATYLETALAMTVDTDAERFTATMGSRDMATVLGVQPLMGRWFLPEECTADGRFTSVVLGGRLWRERFHSDPKIIGRTLRMNGRTRTVVGVMPEYFRFPEISDLFVPLAASNPGEGRSARYYGAIARLKEGASLEQAQAEMRVLTSDLAKNFAATNAGTLVRAVDYKDALVRQIRPMMLLLSLAVGFVLLIACANVANLLLARATTRSREIGVRLAMGASRGRLVRQMLTESLLLSALGAAGGVLLSEWGMRMTLAAIPTPLPFWMKFEIDGVVLAYTAGIAVFAGLVFGLAPALQATGGDVLMPLREGSSASGESPGRRRTRDALVVAEIAMAVVLLIGSGLMVRSFLRMQEQRSVLRSEGVLTGGVSLPFATYPDDARRLAFFRELQNAVVTMPGVKSAGYVNNLHLGNSRWSMSIQREGATDQQESHWPQVSYNIASPGYLESVGLRVLKGRDFNSGDVRGGLRVALVNQAAADELWPKQDPLGKRFRFSQDDSLGWATVVGVIPTVRQNIHTSSSESVSEVLLPLEQSPLQSARLVVLASGDLGGLATRIRRMIRERDSELVFSEVRSLDESVRYATWEPRLYAQLLGTFSLLALVIAALGIYGVMAYSVAQRTREIGIRMALGAARHDVQRMVVGQALRLTLLGMGIGLALAYALTRFMASQLFGVRPDDPPTFAGVTFILAASALLAAWLPAARATRVDPMVALRHD